MQKSKPIVQNIYSKCLLTRQITFNINDLSKSFDEIIKQNISFNYEGKCAVEGFIKKGSTRIINKSAGLIEKGINVVFEIVFECDICYMVEGTIIQCIVKTVTNAGITAEIEIETPSPLICFPPECLTSRLSKQTLCTLHMSSLITCINMPVPQLLPSRLESVLRSFHVLFKPVILP